MIGKNPLLGSTDKSSSLIKGWLGKFLWRNESEQQGLDRFPVPKAEHDLCGWRFGLLFTGLLLAYAAIASCSIRAPFFPLDDMDEFCLVRASHSWTSLLGTDLYHFFRPVKNIMFVGYNWLYYHRGMVAVRIVPMLIGWLSAFAVFGLCRRLLASRRWALVATAIWLLSPTLVSSEAWLSASNILLMTGLAAAALTCHDLACESEESKTGKARIKAGAWSVCAVLCLSLALFSYEGAVSVIALFFAMDWYLRPKRLQRLSTWQRYLAYGLVLVIYLILRHHAQSTQNVLGGFSGVSRFKAAVSSGYFTMLHAGIWFWPFNRMAVIGGYYWGQVSMVELAVCALVVMFALVFSILRRWRYPHVALGILWFLLAFAPMSNVLGFRNGPYCDSYIVLASVGVAITLTAILRGLWPRLSGRSGMARSFAVAVVTLLLASRVAAAFEAATWSSSWNNPIIAYERTLRTFPLSFDAMSELAKLYVARKEYSKADELATKSIELAPDRSGSYAVRAVVAEQEGRIPDALQWLELYRKFSHFDSWGLTFEADIYADHLNQPRRAESLYRKAITHRPWSQDELRPAYELAYMLAQEGHQTEAISIWEELLTYSPSDTVVHWNLSLAYEQIGDPKRAAYHRSLAQSLARNPSAQTTGDKIFQ